MIRDSLIDTAIRPRVDGPMMRARARLTGSGRGCADELREMSDLLESRLSVTSNCIGIGACRGRVPDQTVRLAPGGHHIAYEPLPRTYRMLQHRFPSVDVRHAAVSDHSGETTFTMVRDASALSGIRGQCHDDDQHRTEMIGIRLESLESDPPGGSVPHLLEVDVEGEELAVFEGVIRTNAMHKPTILFDHGKGGADHENTRSVDIHRLPTGVGLRISERGSSAPLTETEFGTAVELKEQWILSPAGDTPPRTSLAPPRRRWVSSAPGAGVASDLAGAADRRDGTLSPTRIGPRSHN